MARPSSTVRGPAGDGTRAAARISGSPRAETPVAEVAEPELAARRIRRRASGSRAQATRPSPPMRRPRASNTHRCERSRSTENRTTAFSSSRGDPARSDQRSTQQRGVAGQPFTGPGDGVAAQRVSPRGAGLEFLVRGTARGDHGTDADRDREQRQARRERVQQLPFDRRTHRPSGREIPYPCDFVDRRCGYL